MLYRLGETELDAARFELRREGRSIPVEPQVFELLRYLIQHRDRAVTRTELFEKLWRGRVVTESALNSRIKAARAAIGDDGTSQSQIRTLHRTGYRFVGAVDELQEAGAGAVRPAAGVSVAPEPPLEPPPARPQPTARPNERPPVAFASSPEASPARRRLGLVSAALGLVLAGGAFSLLPDAVRESSPATAALATTTTPAPADGLLWRPVLSNARSLHGFKDLVRREGLVDYWRDYGWPDLCRPTPGDDFECH